MEKEKLRAVQKLDNVATDIRGPVMDEAMRMEARGANILKLNIGNPAPLRLLCAGRGHSRHDL